MSETVKRIPLLSVIIPIHDSERYLNQCLDSVVNQTLKDIEIICVDDGSKDNSRNIVKEYSKKDSRIILIEQENKGAGAARNNGMRFASGKYIHFLDSDDWLEEDAYEKICNKMITSNVDVCVFQAYLYDNISGVSVPSIKAFEVDDHIVNIENNPAYLTHTRVVPWNKICKRSLITNNKIQFDEIVCANDRSFYFKLILYAKAIMVCRDLLIHYRSNNKKSLIGSVRSKHYDAHFKAYESTMSAYSHNKDEIKSLIADASIVDFFRFYDRADKFYKAKIYLQLNSFFNKTDLSFFGKSIVSRSWYPRYEYIKKHRLGYFFLEAKTLLKGIVLHLNPGIKTKKKFTRRVREDLIVSLTSFPKRIDTVHIVIKSILNQTVLPGKIYLWLADEQFPNKRKDLPLKLLRLESERFEIRFCDDLKSHKKYYYTMLENPNCIIVTIDDDVIYDEDLLETLLSSYTEWPGAVSAMRVNRIVYFYERIGPYTSWIQDDETLYKHPSMSAIGIGVGGILYPPGIFTDSLFDKKAIFETCLFGDDLWLKFNQVLNNIKTVRASPRRTLKYIDGTQDVSLWFDNKVGGRNDEQIKKIDSFFQSTLGTSPIMVMSKSFGKLKILISYLVDCWDKTDEQILSMIQEQNKEEAEVIFFNVKNHNVSKKIRKIYGQKSHVKVVYNNSNFKTPLFLVAKYADGPYVKIVESYEDLQSLEEDIEHISENGVENIPLISGNSFLLPRLSLVNNRIYHLSDLFSKSLFINYLSPNTFTGSISGDDIDSSQYNSVTMLGLRKIYFPGSVIFSEKEKNYLSKLIFDTVSGYKDLDAESEELDLHSVFDNNPIVSSNNLCPVCNNISSFRPGGSRLRDRVFCPFCSSSERHRAAMIALFENFNISDSTEILFLNPPREMKEILLELKIDMCGINELHTLNKKYDVIIHCHTLKKKLGVDLQLDRTKFLLKEEGAVIITVPFSKKHDVSYYIPDLDEDVFSLVDRLESYNFTVNLLWNIANYSQEKIELYSINKKEVVIICKNK